jgi:hypothetical protein
MEKTGIRRPYSRDQINVLRELACSLHISRCAVCPPQVPVRGIPECPLQRERFKFSNSIWDTVRCTSRWNKAVRSEVLLGTEPIWRCIAAGRLDIRNMQVISKRHSSPQEIDMNNAKPLHSRVFALAPILAGALSGCVTFGKCESNSCRDDMSITQNVQTELAQHPGVDPMRSA